MKLSGLFLIVLAAPLVWASCSKPGNGGLVGGADPDEKPVDKIWLWSNLAN